MTNGVTGFPTGPRHGSGTTLELDKSRLLISNLDFLGALFQNPGLISRVMTSVLSSIGLSTHRFSPFLQPASTVLNIIGPLVRRTGLTLETFTAEDTDIPSPKAVNNTAWQFWVRTTTGDSIDETTLRAVTEILRSALNWTNPLFAPVYRFPNSTDTRGLLSPLSHLLIVKGRPNSKLEVLRILEQYQLIEAPISTYFPSGYLCVVLKDPTSNTVYDLPKRILEAEKRVIEDIRFDYIPAVVPFATGFSPGDTQYSAQWNLTKINAEAGWNTSTPAILGSGTVVAVIDVGCDLDHQDLASAYVPSKGVTVTGGTTITSYTSSGTGTYTTFNPGNPHGTQCASIIAARYNSLDIAGLAGECQILPIQLANYEPSSLLGAIGYAISPPNGARVINISLDIPTPGFYDVPELKAAIDTANVVICFAAGNDNRQGLWQPAAHPKVIACGASDQEDSRVKKTREITWGSNYGEAVNSSNDPQSAGFLSVVAPGIGIPALVLHTSAPDYILNWGGTSAATPHVAALAALILCKNPTLTSQQVRNIIEVTAAKVPDPSKYITSKLNGPWNSEMGYGRIDAGKALAHRLISQPDYIDKIRTEFAELRV